MNVPETNSSGVNSSYPTALPDRQAALASLLNLSEEKPPSFDLIIIGGGINGTGIARDASERGLSVLLLEKEDFGAGTSAYSSRLIHGGLRYLENLEFDLVHESLQERERLLKNAPHLVRPIALAIPVYERSRKPRWMIGLGMFLYDLLSWGKSLPQHRMENKTRFLQRYPGINRNGLKGGPIFYDAQIAFPERLCVENAIGARETGNALLLNHAEVNGFNLKRCVDSHKTVSKEKNAYEITGVRFIDRLSGQCFEAQGKVIINASGPWVDQLLKLASRQVEPPLMRRLGCTKGSHIIVKKFSGAPETALYVEAQSDGRPFFIIPWRKTTYLIGTTDLYYADEPGLAAADQAEAAYLLMETNRILPGANLQEGDILYTYSGVRPLPYTQGLKTGKITRKHLIEDHQESHHSAEPIYQRLISIIGGKLTTYRNLAEEAVDYAVQAYHLTLPNGKRIPHSLTRNVPLPGGQGINSPKFSHDDALFFYRQQEIERIKSDDQLSGTLSEAGLASLINLYGSRYREVLTLAADHPEWLAPLYPDSEAIAAQLIYAVRQEMACSVSDVILRRLGCGFDEDMGLKALEPVSRLMAIALDWSEEKRQAEMSDYREYVQKRLLAFRNHPIQK